MLKVSSSETINKLEPAGQRLLSILKLFNNLTPEMIVVNVLHRNCIATTSFLAKLH